MEQQKIPNMRNVRQPMWLTASGVIFVMTKLKSHWVAAGDLLDRFEVEGGELRRLTTHANSVSS
jgi:hypothetical protein